MAVTALAVGAIQEAAALAIPVIASDPTEGREENFLVLELISSS